MPLISGTEKNELIAMLRPGKVIAMGKASFEVTAQEAGAQLGGINVRVPDLRMIEYVLQIQFYTSPFANILSHAPMNKKISGNVVGMSIYYVTAGTTLTVEVVAIGPP